VPITGIVNDNTEILHKIVIAFRWCHWHHGNHFYGVTDTAEIQQKNFMVDIPMKLLLHYCSDFSSVIDPLQSCQKVINTAEITSAASLTPLKPFESLN
jgi:rhamnogalacturonyl hydrolase YesR